MPTLTDHTGYQGIPKTFYPNGVNKALAFLGDIRTGTSAGTSGEDALSVLNRKLEADGILERGTADPVFANETALFYYNSTSRVLFIRSASSYIALIGESNIIGHGTSLLQADASQPWIFVKTDEDGFFIKERTGSPGSYTYRWIGPFFEESYESRIIYSSEITPTHPALTWDSRNRNLNFTNSNWSTTASNATWYRIIILPSESNVPQISEPIKIGSLTAEEISYTPPSGSGNFASSVDNVKEGLDAFHNFRATTTDTHGGSLIQTGETTSVTYSNPLTALNAVGSRAAYNFTVQNNLQTYRTNYSSALFIEAYASMTTQAGIAGTIRYEFEVLDSGGNSLTDRIKGTVSSTNPGGNSSTARVRIAGNLPSTFTQGQLVVRVFGNENPGISAGVDRIRFEIRPDIEADEVIIDANDVSGNLHKSTNPITDLEDVVQELDNLPIEYAEYGSIANRTLSAGTTYSFDMAIPELIQRVMQRNGHPYILRLTYQTLVVAGSGAAGLRQDLSSWTFKLTKNELSADLLSPPFSRVDDDSANGTVRHTHTITVDADATKIVGEFGIAAANDADINLTNLEYDYEQPRATVAPGSVTAADVSVTNSEYSNPNNFIGGLRQPLPTGFTQTGLVNDPSNVREALIKTDYMLQLAYNPYQYVQKLDHGSAPVSNSFTITGTNSITSNSIDIPPEIASLHGANLLLRASMKVSNIGSGFDGRLTFINQNNNNAITGTVEHQITDSDLDVNDYINVQQTVTNTNIQDPFRVRLFGFTGNTTSATFDTGYVYVADAPVATGMTSGQTASYTETIIWIAGGTANARYTGSNVDQTLLAGHQWSDYDFLQFNFDTTASGLIIKPLLFTSNSFQSTEGSSFGVLGHTDLYAILIRPTGNNTFRVLWNGGGSLGLRRVLGISTT